MHRVPLLSFHFLLILFLPQVYSFVHPGLLVTNSDIDRVKRKLAAKKEPWLSSWNKLTSIKYSSASYNPRAVSTVDRRTNGALLWRDAAAAFNLALRWKISGDAQYADASARVLVAWANQLKSFGGADDKYLTAGLQGHQLANAAELLRDYPPFARNGFATVTRMLTTLVLPANIRFLNHGEPSEHNHRHFFANWELCNVASAMAIGVLTDDKTSWDFAINYFKNGTGNGAIGNAITNIVKEPGTGNLLGQGQEAGRDQGHGALDYQLLGVIGQQAWNQGEDLFAYDNNRILLGYVPKSRLYPKKHLTDIDVYQRRILCPLQLRLRRPLRPIHQLYCQLLGHQPCRTGRRPTRLGTFVQPLRCHQTSSGSLDKDVPQPHAAVFQWI